MPIEGLKLQMTSAELKELMGKRIEYHSSRTEWLEKKIKELEPDVQKFENDAVQSGKFAGNRVDGALGNFKQQFTHHQNRATLFKFMVEHLIPNETYVLTENDLTKLEVLSGRDY